MDGCRGYKRVYGCGLGDESVVARVGLWVYGCGRFEVCEGVSMRKSVCV